MKKIFLFLCLVSAFPAFSQTLKGMNDAQQLGAMAGLALACNAGNRLDDFELISSYIIANESETVAIRNRRFRQYAEEKLRTYNTQKATPKEECPSILQRFYNLPIFQSTIYADGTVKFPDGKILKPKTKAQMAANEKKALKKAQEPKRNYMIPARGNR